MILPEESTQQGAHFRQRARSSGPPDATYRRERAIHERVGRVFRDLQPLATVIDAAVEAKATAQQSDRIKSQTTDGAGTVDVCANIYRRPVRETVTQYRTAWPIRIATFLLSAVFLAPAAVTAWIESVPPDQPLIVGLDGFNAGTWVRLDDRSGQHVVILSLSCGLRPDDAIFVAIAIACETAYTIRMLLAMSGLFQLLKGRRYHMVVDGGADSKGFRPSGTRCACCGATRVAMANPVCTENAQIDQDLLDGNDTRVPSEPPVVPGRRVVRGYGHGCGHALSALVIAIVCGEHCAVPAAFRRVFQSVVTGFDWAVVQRAHDRRLHPEDDADDVPVPREDIEGLARRSTVRRSRRKLGMKDCALLFGGTGPADVQRFEELQRAAGKRWVPAMSAARSLMRDRLWLKGATIRRHALTIHSAISAVGAGFLWSDGAHHLVHTGEMADLLGGVVYVLEERVEGVNQTFDDALDLEKGRLTGVMMRETGRVKYLTTPPPAPPPAS